jgi:hypothetical protein
MRARHLANHGSLRNFMKNQPSFARGHNGDRLCIKPSLHQALAGERMSCE